MNPQAAAVDFTPTLALLGLGAAIALVPLAVVAWRHRDSGARGVLAALIALTLFLTFDLIVFGSFTRLTDSGLGCPDWPGCYGASSPVAAADHIRAAEEALPGGPVTLTKAWIEMIHRYLAKAVGALVLVATGLAWALRRHVPFSPWLTTATLVWVVVQGLFGMYTVTLKLYPAIVTLHLLGGLVLLMLLAWQHEAFRDHPVEASTGLRRAALAVMGLLGVQVGAGWLGQHQLRRAGLHRRADVQRPVVADDGFPPGLHTAAAPGPYRRRCRAGLRRPGGHPHGATGCLRWVVAAGDAGAGRGADAPAARDAAPLRPWPGDAAGGAGGQRPVQRGARLAARGRLGAFGRRGGLGAVVDPAAGPHIRGARGGPGAVPASGSAS